jgi:hypothetical protein
MERIKMHFQLIVLTYLFREKLRSLSLRKVILLIFN